MAVNLDVKILGDYKDLTKATKGAKKELSALEKASKKMGAGIKGAIAGIGFSALVDGYRTLSKAAIADNKSQATLALTLRNVTGATDSQVASVESSIAAWQRQFGILDDNLRPAYQSLITSTGDVTKANDLMQIAMDTAAATGKPLEEVAKAIGKAFNGSNTALGKLVPSLKNAKDPISGLKKTFEGAAQAAANSDPYMRFDAIIADIQERIGNALLPKLQQFSDWLASPEGVTAIDGFTNSMIDLATALNNLIGPATEYYKWLVKITGLDSALQGLQMTLGWFGIGNDKKNTPTSYGGTPFDSRGYKPPKANKTAWQKWFEDNFGGGKKTGIAGPIEDPRVTRIKANVEILKKAYQDGADAIKSTMQSFQSELTSGFGLLQTGDVFHFSAEKLISQMQRVVNASKTFANDIKTLKQKGASGALIAQITGLGAEQGGTVARGLLESGKLRTVMKLFNQGGSLGTGVGTASNFAITGQSQSDLGKAITKLEGAVTGGGRTYNIKVSNAQASATDIITAIRKYEQRSGRKYLL